MQSGLKRVAVQQAAVNRKLDSLITSVSHLSPSPRTAHRSDEPFDAAERSRTPDRLARAPAVTVNPVVTLSPYVPTPSSAAHSESLSLARDSDREAALIRKIQALPVDALARLTPTQRATYDRVLLQQHRDQQPGVQHSSFKPIQVARGGRAGDSDAAAEAEAELIRKVRGMPVAAVRSH